jgi:hypothetical protein
MQRRMLGCNRTAAFGSIANLLCRDVAILSTVEAGLGIIAASAVTLRPLFRSLYNASTRATPDAGKSPTWRHGYVQRIGISKPSTPYTVPTTPDPENSIPLHTDPRSGKLVISNIRSPFEDANGDVGHDKRGGIRVQRTVEVSRADNESIRSEPHTFITSSGASMSDVEIV